jgi:hypothetical protein
MTNIEKCIAWLISIGFDAHSDDGKSVCIEFGDYLFELSDWEIEYRSKLYDESKSKY